MYQGFLKPFFDFVLALLLLVVASPIFIIVWGLLLIANKGRVFFVQPRPGRNEVVFRLVKFRTMNNKKDTYGNLLPDQARLTKVGKFVRSTSLDELPQLFNVLLGSMSFVGPRPLLIKYLDRYSSTQKRRHEVKPGITGWAQINGRNAISWEKKFEYDVYYVDHRSFRMDMMIIFKTLQKVIQRHGITSVGEATVSEFKGKQKER